MPRLTKIYTRSGDEGNTRLSSGQIVSKDHARVIAFGTVDELNSQIGVVISSGVEPRLTQHLASIQNDLFHLGSDLSFVADDEGTARPVPQIESRHITRLEQLIDELNALVGPLENFILPGGTLGAAQLHVARTVCRRAERAALTLARQEPIGAHVLGYLNRLSDALFVMARYENMGKGVAEPLWDSKA